jgi:hypothetical protein
MEYKIPVFSAFIAPFTDKTTIVGDNGLANAGAFGVEKGKNIRNEFGGYVRMMFMKDIMKNVGLQTKIDLFSNYLNNPQNIDIYWETLINMKVNKYISVTFSTNLIYDDDIIIKVDKDKDGITDAEGPRVQFKQILNVGFSYKF